MPRCRWLRVPEPRCGSTLCDVAINSAPALALVQVSLVSNELVDVLDGLAWSQDLGELLLNRCGIDLGCGTEFSSAPLNGGIWPPFKGLTT